MSLTVVYYNKFTTIIISWPSTKTMITYQIFSQRVGCNLEIGSKASVDECGVCGGDGTSCSKDLHHWGKIGTGCSVSCGGGECDWRR